MEKGWSTTCEKVRNYIPDDLALCILSKLPLKSLKRFGCVRRSWNLLFENNHFMNIFRSNFISYHHSCYDDTFLMLQSTNRDLYSLSGDDFENIVKLNWPNPFHEEDPYFYVLDCGSITGILCLYKLFCGRTVFWNPTTEEFKIIPPSPFHLASPYIYIYDINVDLVGFGYDKVRDDYKLIRYVSYLPHLRDLSYDDLWEIYSLKSNTWKKLDFIDPHLHQFILGFNGNGKRVYINGMCHWWNLSPSDDGGVDLVSFDFDNEVLITTPIPLKLNSRNIYITGLNGSIASISCIWDTTIFDISILGEVGAKESWIKLYSIGPFCCNIKETIGVGNNGDIFFRKKDGNIVWYNLRTQMMEELCIEGEDYSHILIYKNSVLPMGGVNY
ncbi:F-box/kelch-repeat protein At3g06240-like [Trifolium pratense]|uniref:F-box/kelch-repeat protein At3g06240-like n=1 Tax=Trifolium pratense TaxID=57577 RepID=UPI001E692462|nr:F-box/kelch-repeat protein At3g06240-like [Trifolium pratense]